jgi:hypothetical protein
VNFLEYSLFISHGYRGFADSCVAAQNEFDCFFASVWLLEDFRLARFGCRLRLFAGVTHSLNNNS